MIHFDVFLSLVVEENFNIYIHSEDGSVADIAGSYNTLVSSFSTPENNSPLS